MSHLYIRRYQSENSPVFPCPRVRRLEPKTLQVDNLKTKELDPCDPLSLECEEDRRCKGHLFETPEGRILPPSFCVVDEFEVKDQRAYASQRYREEETSHAVFAEEIRNSLKGKRGLLRNKTLGLRPLVSLRAVASCDWSLRKQEVRIPRVWAKKLRLPYRASLGDSKSAIWSFRHMREDENEAGILLRCPIAGDSSIQPVEIGVWDGLTICVHPEMCAPLNLDFDGDEVHVMVLSGEESRKEIETLMRFKTLNAFDEYPSLVKAMLPSQRNSEDFMIGTTLSISELSDYDYLSPLAKGTKAKDTSRSSCVSLPDQVRALSIESMFERWETATSNIVTSHLTVSQGHTFMRQFAVASSSLEADESMLRVPWKGRASLEEHYEEPCTFRGITNPFSGDFYGYPGVRLALRLSSKVFQQLLDLAKSKGTSSDTRLMMSLIASADLEEDERNFYLAKRIDDKDSSAPLFQSFSSLESIPHNYLLVASSDIQTMKDLYDSGVVISSVMLLIKYVMRKMKVNGSNSEVFELATLIYHTMLECKESNLTSKSVTSFLSFTSNDALTSALCDNIGILDLSNLGLSRIGTRSGDINFKSLYTSIALGSFEYLKRRSILRLHQED